jgi:hypothetical protein
MRRAGVVASCLVIVVAPACSRRSPVDTLPTVRGEIVVSLPDGRKQRPNGLDVMVLDEVGFGQHWVTYVGEFNKQIAAQRVTLETAEGQLSALLEDFRSQANLPHLTQAELLEQWQRRGAPTRIRSSRTLGPAGEAKQKEAFRAELIRAALYRRSVAVNGMQQSVEGYEQFAMDVIGRHRVTTVQTDAMGRFDVRVNPGRYVVFAALLLDTGGTARWLVPVEVQRGTTTLTLSSANSSWPFAIAIPAE